MPRKKSKSAPSLWRQKPSKRALLILIPACLAIGLAIASSWASGGTARMSVHVYARSTVNGFPNFEVQGYPVSVAGINVASSDSIYESCNGHNITNGTARGRWYSFNAPKSITCTNHNDYYFKLKPKSGYRFIDCGCGKVTLNGNRTVKILVQSTGSQKPE